MNSFLDTFDEFIDDLLLSDVELLKGELDILLMQHMFQSIDLELFNDIENEESDILAA